MIGEVPTTLQNALRTAYNTLNSGVYDTFCIDFPAFNKTREQKPGYGTRYSTYAARLADAFSRSTSPYAVEVIGRG